MEHRRRATCEQDSRPVTEWATQEIMGNLSPRSLAAVELVNDDYSLLVIALPVRLGDDGDCWQPASALTCSA